ncbi:primosomal protein N' [Ammoniphilus sp. CFH 90114]|uniref:primosomal protein N' n=1 Tax=Ammoniphilus sp. CFH 90114 TaxID=2493665 RepID=UPI00100FFA1B|nr:primosomal protein N' [Ammoniphilus sp. CFH 90114]RXT15045.1 primosomal protein N' [Ammoniphilus sp. CFH 90114]
MYAQVIVDVPNVDADRTFDYQVPAFMFSWIAVGSRVSVPFGHRMLQGYVVGLSKHTEITQLKEIHEVLDVTPPLTEELVSLGYWISRKYICRLYSALQVMLPAALRSSYKKELSVTPDGKNKLAFLPDEQRILEWILKREKVDWDQLLKEFPGQQPFLIHAIRQGWLSCEQVVRDRVTRKTLLYVKKAASDEILSETIASLPKQAQRQKEVLTFMLEVSRPIPLKTLLSELDLSSSSVKALVDKGLLDMEEVEERRDPYAGRSFSEQRKVQFTETQLEVIGEIQEALMQEQHFAFLLHGVTGSGKTEVYLESIAKCLEMGKEAIVLVPEISLTPQMVDRFKGRFGERVAVLHSRLSQGERYDEWKRIREGEVQVVVGARSAIFAPFTNLGLIIMDEEHEGSYKQEETPRYHARDVALQRATSHQAIALFGSATPAMETFYMASNGQVGLLSMPNRVGSRPLPAVEIVDMREELRDGNRTMFSRALSNAITERLGREEQMVLFLNRRGFSTFVMCRSCGHSLQCPHCDISLTYHRTNQTARCHYCGYAEREPEQCPECGSSHIRYFGTGTQKVEEELSKHFPGIRVIRMDVDTTSQKGSHEKLLTMFRQGQGDVLLGTQMIAKGLDFPKVTLVGVIAADTILGMPDFRAAERTYQLLTQVGGRAGRHQLPGEVVIQTYTPEHYSIELAKSQKFESFFSMELKHRFEKGYPPYFKLILFTFTSANVPLAVKSADEWVKKLRHILPTSVYLLGPVASPIPRIKDRYRFQCMLKYRDEPEVLPFIKEMAESFASKHKPEDIQLTVDVDPQMLM